MPFTFPNSRRKSRKIFIGNLPMGGNNPIRIQSMTNTDTNDIPATVEQIMRLKDVGCEYVRITAPGVKEAYALKDIKEELLIRNYEIPLIADIHFNPKAAEIAATIVEKIRINPGNYVDRNRGKIHFTEEEYKNELNQIASRLENLISICKKHHTAIRIGTNHGSLSERIISRYGNTPLGMATSAMEFIRICRDFDFHDLVLSMKASNVNTMVYATRLLAQMMEKEGFDYPIHLGVTEAGDGEDGRIKSAAGIGCLLSEGIGDTIRVSLTEAPDKEIPVARQIASLYHYPIKENYINNLPVEFARRETYQVNNIGGISVPVVISKSQNPLADYFFKDEKTIQNISGEYFPFFESEERFLSSQNKSPILNFVQIKEVPDEGLLQNDTIVFIANPNKDRLASFFELFNYLDKYNSKTPVLILLNDSILEDISIRGSSEIAELFANGWGNGILCNSHVEACFNILQATGKRISKAEFISCPSCGRTQYDIESALQKIKVKTSHLKGIKIGVMGCIVNGPGEMADADYGYVGSGHGKITLYKGKSIIKKDIPESDAVDALIDLIQSSGDWQEKV